MNAEALTHWSSAHGKMGLVDADTRPLARLQECCGHDTGAPTARGCLAAPPRPAAQLRPCWRWWPALNVAAFACTSCNAAVCEKLGLRQQAAPCVRRSCSLLHQPEAGRCWWRTCHSGRCTELLRVCWMTVLQRVLEVALSPPFQRCAASMIVTQCMAASCRLRLMVCNATTDLAGRCTTLLTLLLTNSPIQNGYLGTACPWIGIGWLAQYSIFASKCNDRLSMVLGWSLFEVCLESVDGLIADVQRREPDTALSCVSIRVAKAMGAFLNCKCVHTLQMLSVFSRRLCSARFLQSVYEAADMPGRFDRLVIGNQGFE